MSNVHAAVIALIGATVLGCDDVSGPGPKATPPDRISAIVGQINVPFKVFTAKTLSFTKVIMDSTMAQATVLSTGGASVTCKKVGTGQLLVFYDPKPQPNGVIQYTMEPLGLTCVAKRAAHDQGGGGDA
jgi:hypothetical protein